MDFNSYILNLNDANCYIKGGKYHFYIRDHLGNNRVVIQVIIEDGEEGIKEGVGIEGGTVVQRNDYYPSGLPMTNMLSPDEQQFKYNGKEFDTMNGLNMYDYRARFYDAAIMRWGVIDPSAERYFHFTPYAYVTNNQMKYIDPDGCDRRLVWDNSNSTVTVHATYYYQSWNWGSFVAARTGINDIHGLNDKGYTYIDEDGKTWKVQFKLTAKGVDNPKEDADNDPQGNTLKVTDTVRTLDENGRVKYVAGVSVKQKYIFVRNANKRLTTVAHEMLHTLGIPGHSAIGFMTVYINANRGKYLVQKNIEEILRSNLGIEDMVNAVKNELEKTKAQFDLPSLPPNMRDGSMSAFHEIMYRMYLRERSPEVQSKDF